MITISDECKTCMYFAPKGIVNGECRRHSPTHDGWPVRTANEWCGDYKVKVVVYEFDSGFVPTVDGLKPGEIKWVKIV